MRRFAVLAAAALVMAAEGCGTVDRLTDWWASGPRERSTMRQGAVEYRCDANKILVLGLEQAPQSVWVIFPEREFRLDAVQAASGGRYSNGRTTLITQGDEVSLEDGPTVTHVNCKRVPAG